MGRIKTVKAIPVVRICTIYPDKRCLKPECRYQATITAHKYQHFRTGNCQLAF